MGGSWAGGLDLGLDGAKYYALIIEGYCKVESSFSPSVSLIFGARKSACSDYKLH